MRANASKRNTNYYTGLFFWLVRLKKWLSVSLHTTGSFRKKGKSKTFFLGTKFHEKLIFSAFFSRELATNLRPWATRSVTITLWHPENVAPPVWFQALVGCLKPTTDPETLSKDHKGVFWSVRGTMALLKNMNVFIQLILLDTSQNTMGGLRSKELRQ